MKSLTGTNRSSANQAESDWIATWITGPDCGAVIALGASSAIVGRATTADVRCDDPKLEAHHALIETATTGVLITQLAGRHPLVANGAPIDGTRFCAGMVTIEIGDSRLRIGPKSDSLHEPVVQRQQHEQNVATLGVSDVDLLAGWRRPSAEQPAIARIGQGSRISIQGDSESVQSVLRSVVAQIARRAGGTIRDVVVATDQPDAWQYLTQSTTRVANPATLNGAIPITTRVTTCGSATGPVYGWVSESDEGMGSAWPRLIVVDYARPSPVADEIVERLSGTPGVGALIQTFPVGLPSVEIAATFTSRLTIKTWQSARWVEDVRVTELPNRIGLIGLGRRAATLAHSTDAARSAYRDQRCQEFSPSQPLSLVPFNEMTLANLSLIA